VSSTGAIDSAVIAVLTNDTTLSGLAPGGVYRDIAPQDVASPFVIVSQMAHEDTYGIGSRRQAYETITYVIKGVANGTSGTTVQTIADRIHALLQGVTLSVTGYNALLCERTERIAYVEVDDQSDRRWQHRGGMYEVTAEPLS